VKVARKPTAAEGLLQNPLLSGCGQACGFRILSGEADLTQYLFNTRKNQHYFCKHCGIRAIGVGTETPLGVMYGVNLGCLEDLSDEELSRIPITYVDGRQDRFAPPEHSSHL
jgi:hypothetical protein